MKHHYILWTLFLTLSCSLFGEQKPEKPNILFLFADDLSFETIGALKKTNCQTPHLDRLMKRGAHFTQTFNMGSWAGAVCAASRAMLNSGTFVNSAKSAIKEKPRWSELMKGAGYRTYMTGKWHVPGKPRFDVTAGVKGGMPKQTKAGYNRPLSPEDYATGWKPWDKAQSGFWKGGTHWSEVITQNTVGFLNEAKEDDHPFFMYIAFNAPHDPRQAPKKYIDMYPLESMVIPDNYLANYPYDEEIGCSPTVLRDERLMPSPRTEYAVKVHRQEYFALVTHMDDQIGIILDELEKTGKADNTYIVFTADHGLSVGHHGLVGKQNMYDHSMRVPFFIAGPGIEPGTSFDMPIYLQDVMATSLEWAQVQKPEHVQFKSVMPLIRGEESTQYDRIYGKYINYQRMIVKGDYKLMFYSQPNIYRLFNVAKDPSEVVDLAQSPEYAELLGKMRKDLKVLMAEMKDDLDLDHPEKAFLKKKKGKSKKSGKKKKAEH